MLPVEKKCSIETKGTEREMVENDNEKPIIITY